MRNFYSYIRLVLLFKRDLRIPCSVVNSSYVSFTEKRNKKYSLSQNGYATDSRMNIGRIFMRFFSMLHSAFNDAREISNGKKQKKKSDKFTVENVLIITRAFVVRNPLMKDIRQPGYLNLVDWIEALIDNWQKAITRPSKFLSFFFFFSHTLLLIGLWRNKNVQPFYSRSTRAAK